MKRNLYKLYTKENKFARNYYCSHLRLAITRSQKKAQKKKFRKVRIVDEIDEY